MAENINIGGRLHSTATGNVVAGANEIYDDTKGKKQSVVNAETDTALENRYTKSETYNKTELNNMITTPNQMFVSVTATDQTTAATDVLPATGSADTVYRVGSWDGIQYEEGVYSEYSWNGSAYVHLSTKTEVGEVYDISAAHATGGELATYADLSAALGTSGANIPQSLRKGGMSVKFVQSSDNKYVKFFCTADEFTTDVTKWQSFEADVQNNYDSDFSIADENGKEIVRFANGHIQTKKFNSSTVKEPDVITDNTGTCDLEIDDENDAAIVKFKDGHIQTKNFESKYATTYNGGERDDFRLEDEKDNILVSFAAGHIKTKMFNSYDVTTKLGAIYSKEGVDDIRFLNPKSIYDTLVTNSPRQRHLNRNLVGKSPVTLCHFSDLHHYKDNLNRLLQFNQRYDKYINDVIFCGDVVYNLGTEEIDFWKESAANILMCIGNHEAWIDQDIEDTEQLYKEPTNGFWLLSQNYVYNKFMKDFISNWGAVQPEDAVSEGKSYYYKDYNDANNNTYLRLIVLDCMHYGTINDAIDETHSKQDNWFVSVLNDCATNHISVVVASHYWPFEVTGLSNCGYCEYEGNLVGLLNYDQKGIFHNFEAASRVQDFINAGGEFVCWITGHSHRDFIGTNTNYPGQLMVSIAHAGGEAPNYSSTNRDKGTKGYDCFNYITFDTNDKLIKLVRIGADVDRLMNTKRVLTYRYKEFTDPNTSTVYSVGLEKCF